jgi:hypothetical protein
VPVTPSFQSQSQAGGQQAGGASISLFVPEAPGRASGQWWPAELGLPNGSGGQNQMRYAYFNATHRLAVELNGHVTVYDSLDHQIGGVSQQQGSGGSVTFTSQYGTIPVDRVPGSAGLAIVPGVAHSLKVLAHCFVGIGDGLFWRRLWLKCR